MKSPRLVLLAVSCIAAVVLVACGSGVRARGGVIIEPLDTQTPVSAAAAARVTAVPKAPAGAAPAAPTTAPAATQGLDATPAAETSPASATPAAEAPAEQSIRPATGRWIEVDVTRFIVRLMDGDVTVRTISPVAVGLQVDTGAYESTQTGLFHVYNKLTELSYDPPYKTYISDWVGFDPAKDNGFHSFLKDKDGNVVVPDTGRVSNGCIRTPDAAAITAFAEIGMPVWVHA